jgi:HAD superfamily hydrolase (TIGR01509 family)
MRAVLFDLDGVLLDARAAHAEHFASAVREVAGVRLAPHEEAALDGRSTRAKLAALAAQGRLPHRSAALQDAVAARKQEKTREFLRSVRPFPPHVALLAALKAAGLRVAVVSNAVAETVHAAVAALGVAPLLDAVLSNADAVRPKPAPDLYLAACARLGVPPASALVVEDSAVGRSSALAAGCPLLRVADPLDVTAAAVVEALRAAGARVAASALLLRLPPAEARRLAARRGGPPRVHLVVPMAGAGSRFAEAGFVDPKPFIPVGPRRHPMIRHVLANLLPRAASAEERAADPAGHPDVVLHLIAQAAHLARYDLAAVVAALPAPPAAWDVRTVPAVTQGAACTVLLAADAIDGDEPLVIANSDQLLEWDAAEFYRAVGNPGWDGVVASFHQPDAADLKWSYAAVDAGTGAVARVAEKEWLGQPHATVGVYGWARGADFVAAARRMVAADERVRGEFYVAPAYNGAIAGGARVRLQPVARMWGVGVPADLAAFEAGAPDALRLGG